MTIAGTPYPSPVYSLNNATTSQTGAVIDIGSCTLAAVPPVLICTVVGSVTYVIEGSHDATNFSPSPTSLTASAMKDLIIGIRFWRVTYSSGTGTLTASVGAVPNQDGRLVVPNLKQLTNNPGAGA